MGFSFVFLDARLITSCKTKPLNFVNNTGQLISLTVMMMIFLKRHLRKFKRMLVCTGLTYIIWASLGVKCYQHIFFKFPYEIFKDIVLDFCRKFIKQVRIEVNLLQSVYNIWESYVERHFTTTWMIVNCMNKSFHFIRHIFQGI